MSLLHVSAPLVTISREVHHKRWTYQEITNFLNQPTDVKYYVLTICGLKYTPNMYNTDEILW